MTIRLLIVSMVFLASRGFAVEKLDLAKLDKIAEATEAAIKRGDCPGAVVLVLRANEVIYRKAFGNRRLHPEIAPMTIDGIFDMASLTKPVATGTAIMLLHERGKIAFDDKIIKYWPEFGANGKDKITVEQLLTHTSGLLADNAAADYKMGREEAMKRIAALKLDNPPGEKFKYSDVGFITLGILVEKIAGETLDAFTRKNVFEPLGMKDSGYVPAKELQARAVPTAKAGDDWLQGKVHDPRADALGGVAGHAGLFSTADDMAIYAKMLLNGGKHAGKQFLSEKSVKEMTEPLTVPGGARSRAWDVDTSYSSPRGDLFGKRDGFGHTGFTGTSLWVDRPSDTAVIILTNRVHISEKVQVTGLRRQIATIVAEVVGKMPAPKSP
ncbi:serine hydrolase domain-containing protein [Zavarzinella formosa]|uniref:serine hydrolase domain-containing protein n=1 Tax=Zavarzinella formosa TaxID=360055 RepID=UPI0002F0C175|nr:serine hydrolase domain-containing protein [Zavarzinella formosa]